MIVWRLWTDDDVEDEYEWMNVAEATGLDTVVPK